MQITGKAEIRIDGKAIPMENGATLNPGGATRNPEKHGGNVYYSEQEEPPMLEGVVLHTKDVDNIYLSSIKDATVMFIPDNGSGPQVLRKAFTVEPVPHSGDGKSPIKMSGQAVEQL